MTEPIFYEMPKIKESPIAHGDIRKITMEVEVLFEYSDKIVSDYDSETGQVLEYTEGFIVNVLTKKAIYKGEPTIFMAASNLQ